MQVGGTSGDTRNQVYVIRIARMQAFHHERAVTVAHDDRELLRAAPLKRLPPNDL